jgi:tetratricopeptide (TPR) repeat protein
MKNSNLIIAGMLLLAIIFSGFQCSSKEMESAKLYYQQENWDKAIAALKEEVQKNPKSDDGYYWLGLVYAKKGEIDSMVQAFDNSLQISDKYKADIEKERYFEWQEAFNRGVSLFQRASKTEDQDSSMDFYDRSVKEYDNAILLEPDSGDTYKNLAFVYLVTQRNEEAIKPLQKLIDLDQAEEGYQYLGEVYNSIAANSMNKFRTDGDKADSSTAMEYYTKTISLLAEGLNKYPDNSDMLTTRFNAYIGADRMDEALSSAKALVDKDPGNKFSHYNYGVVLLKLGKFEEAEQQFQKAIDLDPEYENAIYNIGVTYVSWGTAMNKEAEKQGLISEDYKKKYQAALPYLETVVEKDPTNVAIWELLGKVYSVLGMNDDANNAFKKADELR